MTDLRCGDWRDVLPDVEVDALITDPPYSAKVHRSGALIEGADDAERSAEKRFMSWGTLPGAYTGAPPSRASAKGAKSIVFGQKPQWLIEAIVRDYSRPGDLVCDPFSGSGTTARACEALGRRFVGAESDPKTHALASERLSGSTQIDLFGGAA